MTHQLALDLGPSNITVNAIAPGFIEVARTMGAVVNYNRDEIAGLIPIGRVGISKGHRIVGLFIWRPRRADSSPAR